MRDFVEHFSSKPAFTAGEVKYFLYSRGASNGYHKLILQNLLRAGKLKKFAKGCYSFHDEVQYVGFAFYPFYYGLEDALSLRGIWNQQTNPVVITPRKVRNGVRTYDGRNYIIRRIDRKMFFGYGFITYGEFQIPVSENEKTFIDLIYFRESISHDVLVDLLRSVKVDELQDYLTYVPPELRKKVNKVLSENQE